MAGIKVISNWLINAHGKISGTIKGSEDFISTSRAVSREGDVVTTKSGSNYRVDTESPHPFIADHDLRTEHYGGASTVIEALDYAIEQAKKK